MIKDITNIIINENKLVITGKNKQPVYDMYYLTVKYNTGESKIIKAFTFPNTIDVKTANRKLLEMFFAKRLQGLMEKQGREDYIFLGRLELRDNIYHATRSYMLDGINAQTKFNNDYKEIEKELESQKNNDQLQPKNFTPILPKNGKIMYVVIYMECWDHIRKL